MRDAIRYLRETFGCRVFNVSLGDDRLPYQNGKVSPWASVLDTLARDLDIVIVVSAGNFEYDPGIGGSPDGHVHEYPRYLLSGPARIIEPATGAVVLTVGALAHSARLPPGSAVALRPIAQAMQPSPFTRAGPGLGGSIKPEVCDVGGSHAYDGAAHGTQDVRELGVISGSPPPFVGSSRGWDSRSAAGIRRKKASRGEEIGVPATRGLPAGRAPA
jgi:hypothetical protein